MDKSRCKCKNGSCTHKSGAISVVLYDLRGTPLSPQVTHELEDAVEKIATEHQLVTCYATK